MSSKSKRKPRDVSMHKAVSIAMTIFVWAWMSCFNPTQEDVNKLSAEVVNIRESGGGGEHPGERRKRQSQRLDGA